MSGALMRANDKPELKFAACPTKKFQNPPAGAQKEDLTKEVHTVMALLGVRSKDVEEVLQTGHSMRDARAHAEAIGTILNEPPSADSSNDYQEAVAKYKRYHSALNFVVALAFENAKGKMQVDLGGMSFRLPKKLDLTAWISTDDANLQFIVSLGGLGLKKREDRYGLQKYGDDPKTFMNEEPDCNWEFLPQVEAAIAFLAEQRHLMKQVTMKWWEEQLKGNETSFGNAALEKRVWKNIVAFITPLNNYFAGTEVDAIRRPSLNGGSAVIPWTRTFYEQVLNSVAMIETEDFKGNLNDEGLKKLATWTNFFRLISQMNFSGKGTLVTNLRIQQLKRAIEDKLKQLPDSSRKELKAVCAAAGAECSLSTGILAKLRRRNSVI